MDKIEFEGAPPFHLFPDKPNRVKGVAKSNPARPNEGSLHKPKDGIHTVDKFGNQVDISQEALDRLAAEEQDSEE
jgi:hypothetical protein